MDNLIPCPECSTLFTPRGPLNTLCSKKCGAARHRKREKAVRLEANRNQVCEDCGTTFADERKRKYCSNACMGRFNSRKWAAGNRDYKRAYNSQYRDLYPDKVAAQSRAAYQKRADYYRERNSIWYFANRESALDTARAYVSANPESVRLAKSRYKHKRRALEGAATFIVSGAELRRGFARSPQCAYCNAPFAEFREATWDHVIPVTKGGSFGIGNLVPCCGSCNSSKGNKTVMEWRVWKRRMALAA